MSVAMTDPRDYAALARTAEEVGFDQIAVPDSIFWSEQVSDLYPYTKDGSRLWQEDTPFVDPFMAVATMAAVTTRIRFCTHVVKVAVRNPLLLAKQVSSAAVLSGDRFTFGAGVGWLKEEFEWCGQSYEGRGPRTDESLDAIMELLTGDWVSRDGEHVQFGRIKQPPSPGAAGAGLHRRAHAGRAAADRPVRPRLDQREDRVRGLQGAAARAGRHAALGRAARSRASPTRWRRADRWGLDGYKELEQAGATDLVAVPWMFYGVPWDGPLADKQDGIRKFAKDVIGAW